MNVHWSAVFFGWLIDFAISLVVQVILALMGADSFFLAPSFTQISHILFFSLFVGATGVGGFIAARIANESFTLNGFMVGVTGILISAMLNTAATPTPRFFIIGQAIGCAIGALGGWLAYKFPRQKQA